MSADNSKVPEQKQEAQQPKALTFAQWEELQLLRKEFYAPMTGGDSLLDSTEHCKRVKK